MFYGFLADVVVAVHVGYVSYVVLGQLVIFAGVLLGWRAVRNPWFRWSHLLMICIVAVESIGNVACPLTTWEYQLRRAAGQRIDTVTPPEVVAASMLGNLACLECGPIGAANIFMTEAHGQPTFIGRCLHDILFMDLPFDHVGFRIAYITFALLTIATFVLAPPRSFRKRHEQTEDANK